MAIKVMSQRDFILTEATVKTDDLNELAGILKAAKANAKIVAVYNQGGTIGVNIEQRTRIPEGVSAEVRKLVGVNDREL
jgi:hypothetical protein